MKKLILSTTFLIAGTFSVLAQGVVDFSNAPWEAWPEATPPDRLIYVDRVGGTPVSDATWTAALFENRGGTWTKLGDSLAFFGTGLEGIIATDGVQRSLSVGLSAATQLKIAVYNGQGALLGESPAFAYTHAASSPPSPTDTLMVNLRAFAVPEPSTVALGVLGLGALLLFRRRK
jgi:hypothetical protein